jgi:hypothetical protein
MCDSRQVRLVEVPYLEERKARVKTQLNRFKWLIVQCFKLKSVTMILDRQLHRNLSL